MFRHSHDGLPLDTSAKPTPPVARKEAPQQAASPRIVCHRRTRSRSTPDIYSYVPNASSTSNKANKPPSPHNCSTACVSCPQKQSLPASTPTAANEDQHSNSPQPPSSGCGSTLLPCMRQHEHKRQDSLGSLLDEVFVCPSSARSLPVTSNISSSDSIDELIDEAFSPPTARRARPSLVTGFCQTQPTAAYGVRQPETFRKIQFSCSNSNPFLTPAEERSVHPLSHSVDEISSGPSKSPVPLSHSTQLAHSSNFRYREANPTTFFRQQHTLTHTFDPFAENSPVPLRA